MGGGVRRSFILRPCTGTYSVLASLYNILHKYAEHDNLSQASMPFATKNRAFRA